MDSCAFSLRPDGTFATPGIDFSGTITQVHESTNGFAVWHKTGGSCWSGVGMARTYVPAELWIIQVRPHYYPLSQEWGDRAFILKTVEPGRRHRSALREMIAECDRMAKSANPA